MAIVQEAGSEWSMRKLVKVMRPHVVWRKFWRWLRDRRRYAGDREAQFFFGQASPLLEREDLVKQVPHINHPDVVKLVSELDPDLIAVFGTSLIRGALLNKGRLGIVNLHGGLSPEYRGADCTFWALYNREPEKVGCTLHYIDSGIDTGGLIAHVSPEVHSDDDELSLFWRGVKESANVFAELLQKLASGEKYGETQSGKGGLYQVKQRGFRHELRVERMLRKGLLRNLELGLRVIWFPTLPPSGQG
jgi:methionyl-tRNA formyltransferase